MNFPKIIEIKPKEDLTLLVKFENGIIKRMDIKPYIDTIAPFKILQDREIFNKVHIENYGHVIVWDKMLDIDGADAWTDGEIVNMQ